jgi:hypothetical protein
MKNLTIASRIFPWHNAVLIFSPNTIYRTHHQLPDQQQRGKVTIENDPSPAQAPILVPSNYLSG